MALDVVRAIAVVDQGFENLDLLSSNLRAFHATE
jgi:hypothetical protein